MNYQVLSKDVRGIIIVPRPAWKKKPILGCRADKEAPEGGKSTVSSAPLLQ